MSAERLLTRLAARGCQWPSPVEHFDVVSSTNDRAKDLAREGASAWTVVIADRQSAGRGRAGHEWVSPRGNLHVSVLLRPRIAAAQASLLPLVAGLAAAEAVAEAGVDPFLKWPNDLMVAGRKLGGVLVESSLGGTALEWVVVGVGVNVAADPSLLEPGLAGSATTLLALTGSVHDPLELAAALLLRLRDRLLRLEAEGPIPALQAWRARSLPWWGSAVEVLSGRHLVRGRALDVDERGALVLQLAAGSRLVLLAGEVRELRPLSEGSREGEK